MAKGILRVALTGGIATGKSYCLEQFTALGVPVVDADTLARKAVAPGGPALDAVVARFGRDMLRPDGTLDREALARVVFADAGARRDLEAIIHPIVYAEIRSWFDHLAAAGERMAHGEHGQIVGIADIPLLYETGHERDFDRVIVVFCRPEQQVARLLARPGMTREEADRRIKSQLPIEAKARRADYVIDTSGPHEETNRQIEKLWTSLGTG